jgi:hypothetical protein
VYYRRAFTVQGVPVIASVTNLTAAFLDDLFADGAEAAPVGV